MDDPRKLMEFIERNNLGYTLGRAFIAIVRAANLQDKERLTELREARNLLNICIKRIK